LRTPRKFQPSQDAQTTTRLQAPISVFSIVPEHSIARTTDNADRKRLHRPYRRGQDHGAEEVTCLVKPQMVLVVTQGVPQSKRHPWRGCTPAQPKNRATTSQEKGESGRMRATMTPAWVGTLYIREWSGCFHTRTTLSLCSVTTPPLALPLATTPLTDSLVRCITLRTAGQPLPVKFAQLPRLRDDRIVVLAYRNTGSRCRSPYKLMSFA